MQDISYTRLLKRITRLRWTAPILAFVLVLGHQLAEHTILVQLPRWEHFLTQLLFYGLVGPALAWWALTSLLRSVTETQTAVHAVREAVNDLQTANERLAFLLRVNRRLAESENLDQLCEVILALPLDVVPAAGCSLIRYDDRAQPQLAMHHGALASEAYATWMEHVSVPETKEVCAQCRTHCTSVAADCPLLLQSAVIGDIQKVFCVDLERAGRKFGVLTIYLTDADRPTAQEAVLLNAMAGEMSLALESLHLRARELETLLRLQDARRTKSLHEQLHDMLMHLVDGFDVQGGLLLQVERDAHRLSALIEAGEPLRDDLDLVRHLATSANQVERPLVIHDLSQEERRNENLRSLLFAPLRNRNALLLGVMVLWSSQPDIFSRRRLQLLEVVAGQTALLLDNYQLYLKAEQQAALDERSRLAREIHDGLAQTLSYTQLRIARMRQVLASGRAMDLAEELKHLHELIDHAYDDARSAIDQLRLHVKGANLRDWVAQLIADYHRKGGLHIDANGLPELTLPTPVQIQLFLIVQEALENVNKHSQCEHAELRWDLDEFWLTLRISDQGAGFDPATTPMDGHHGLQIMRERADLLDADFQVISRLGGGTKIELRLPVGRYEKDLASE